MIRKIYLLIQTLNIQLYDCIDLWYNRIWVDIPDHSTVQDTLYYSFPLYNHHCRLIKIKINAQFEKKTFRKCLLCQKEKKNTCKYQNNFQESRSKHIPGNTLFFRAVYFVEIFVYIKEVFFKWRSGFFFIIHVHVWECRIEMPFVISLYYLWYTVISQINVEAYWLQ